MSLKLRFILLLGFLLAAFATSLLLLRQMEHAQLGRILATSQKSSSHLMERWIDITGQSLRQFANDYSLWDEMLTYTQHPDSTWGEINITASLPNFNVHSAWVLRPDFSVVYASPGPNAEKTPLPWSAADLATITQNDPFGHFFAEADGKLLEIHIAPIHPSNDIPRTSTPQGWFIAGRDWSESHLITLAGLAESRVWLEAPGQPRKETLPGIHLLRPLADWRGRTLRTLHLHRVSPEVAQVLEVDAFESRIFVVFGLLVIAMLGLSLQLWVLRPLGWIGESLARHSTDPIRSLLNDRTELSRVAQLIESSFAQRTQLVRENEDRRKAEEALRVSEDALRRNLAERVRLGRDLHDGVIQNIYAAGMGLTAARSLLPAEPVEASRRIEYVRAALNDTIRDLRNFITGLEPEALKQQKFSHAVAVLLDFLQSISPIQATLDIDETAAEQLSTLARTDALQIIREAVSNSLRHGSAHQVKVSLQATTQGTRLIITDDGRGFDPEHPAQYGHGLINMRERANASEAEFALTSSPSTGTRITVTFPPAGL